MWEQTYSFKFTKSVPLISRYFPLQRKKQKVRRKQETSFKSIWTKVLQPPGIAKILTFTEGQQLRRFAKSVKSKGGGHIF